MKTLILTIFLILGIGQFAVAQDGPSISSRPLESGTVLRLKNEYPNGIIELSRLNPLDGNEELFLDLRQASYQIPVFQLSEGRFAFTLEVEGAGTWDTGFFPLAPSRIAKLDLQTGEREIVYSRTNLVDFEVSPNQEYTLIKYYPEEVSTVDRSNLEEARWCILNLTMITDTCRLLEFADGIITRPIWATFQMIAYIPNSERSINLIHADTLDTEIIPLPDDIYATDITRMPVTGNLLIYDGPFLEGETGKLLALDTTNKTVRFISDTLDVQAVHQLRVSLLEDSVVLVGTSEAVWVDLQTGQILRRYPTIYDMQWTDIQWLPTEHTDFLIGRMQHRGRAVLTVVFAPTSDFALAIFPEPPEGGRLIVIR